MGKADNNNWEEILKQVFQYKETPKMAHLTAETYSKMTGVDIKSAKKTLERIGVPLEYEGWYEITLPTH